MTCTSAVASSWSYLGWDSMSEVVRLKTCRDLNIHITNIHQKQQLQHITNQALKLYRYLSMHMYVYLNIQSVFITTGIRRELTVADSSHGSMLPWPLCVMFLMLLHFFTESDKLILLQRNLLYLSDTDCIAFNLPSLSLNGVVRACVFLHCWAMDKFYFSN